MKKDKKKKKIKIKIFNFFPTDLYVYNNKFYFSTNLNTHIVRVQMHIWSLTQSIFACLYGQEIDSQVTLYDKTSP